MSSSFAALAGMGLLAILIMVVVGVAIAALALAVAFRLVVGHMPSYLRALGAVVLTSLASALVAAVFHLVSHGGGSLLVLAAQFLVGAAVVNYLLPAATGQPIGFGKACVVQLVYLVMAVVLAFILGLVMAMMFGGMLAGMH